MLLLGFWNAIRVEYVGWKRDETVTSIWDRLRGAVAVVCLTGVVVPFGWGRVGGGTQSSTVATEQTPKPASKSKTTSTGKTNASGTAGSGKTKPAGSSKTTKGKSAAASKTRAKPIASRKPTAQTIRTMPAQR